MEIPSSALITYYITGKGNVMSDDRLMLENVRLIFRNFAGVQTKFNEEGKRNFCVLLDTDIANKLKAEGWNVRWSEARDEGDEAQGYMQVTVSYDNYPPTITLVSNKNKSVMRVEDLAMLDWAEIAKADLVIRPYKWKVNDNEGIKAYLKSAYFTLEDDPLAEKYEGIPSTPKSAPPIPDVVDEDAS